MRYALCNNARNCVILAPFLYTIKMISGKLFDLCGFSLNMRALGGFILNLPFNSKWLCSLWGNKNQLSCSVVSDSLRPEGLQHTRLPCLSSTMTAYSNSCALSPWCHPPSHPLLSPSPPTFNLSQHQGLFQWVSSSHQVAKVLGVSASSSVLPMNTEGWFHLGWTAWISLLSKGLSRVFSNTTVQKHQFFSAQLSL